MRTKLTLGILALVAMAGVFSVRVRAQTVSHTFAVAPTFLLANCVALVPTLATFCPTGDGHIYFAPAGSSTFTCIAGCVVPTSGVLKVQGVGPGATGNVQLTCTGTIGTQMATFSAGTSTSAQFPGVSVPVNCVGQGN